MIAIIIGKNLLKNKNIDAKIINPPASHNACSKVSIPPTIFSFSFVSADTLYIRAIKHHLLI